MPESTPSDPTTARPNRVPPEDTINEESVADEASFESFPASDPPSWTGSQAGPPPSLDHSAEDDEEEPQRG
jgi:hypothetical protein